MAIYTIIRSLKNTTKEPQPDPMTTNNPPNERKAFIIRTIIIITLLLGNLVGIYLYYYVLIFKSVEPGKVYGESTFNGGRYEVHTLKYYYQHKGITYFDKVDYVIGQELQLGDSLAVRVLRPYPPMHMVEKIYRDESKAISYDCEKGFIIRYNEAINTMPDYEAKSFSTIHSEQDYTIHVDNKMPENMTKKIIEVIDNIRFNHGSLVEYFILKMENEAICLYSVYYYTNAFATDAMPSKLMHQQLKRIFPDKEFHLSVLDKNQPKKERMLDVNW